MVLLMFYSNYMEPLSSVSGHEFPFSIQMSHVRNTMSQGAGGGDTERQKAMQVEQMQVYKQCQFIMKPRPAEALHGEFT